MQNKSTEASVQRAQISQHCLAPPSKTRLILDQCRNRKVTILFLTEHFLGPWDYSYIHQGPCRKQRWDAPK